MPFLPAPVITHRPVAHSQQRCGHRVRPRSLSLSPQFTCRARHSQLTSSLIHRLFITATCGRIMFRAGEGLNGGLWGMSYGGNVLCWFGVVFCACLCMQIKKLRCCKSLSDFSHWTQNKILNKQILAIRYNCNQGNHFVSPYIKEVTSVFYIVLN